MRGGGEGGDEKKNNSKIKRQEVKRVKWIYSVSSQIYFQPFHQRLYDFKRTFHSQGLRGSRKRL